MRSLFIFSFTDPIQSHKWKIVKSCVIQLLRGYLSVIQVNLHVRMQALRNLWPFASIIPTVQPCQALGPQDVLRFSLCMCSRVCQMHMQRFQCFAKESSKILFCQGVSNTQSKFPEFPEFRKVIIKDTEAQMVRYKPTSFSWLPQIVKL